MNVRVVMGLAYVMGCVTAARGQAESKFEVAAVRRSDPASSASQLRGSVASDRFPACGGYRMEIDPGRFAAANVTVYKLITWAYGIRYSCYIVNDAGLVSGGPKWILTDRFDIQATIPAGTPAYTPQQLADAAAPELQAMLRDLLADRFKLALRNATNETRVYELALAAGGPKLPAPDREKPKRETLRIDADENQENLVHVIGNQASMADLAHLLETVTAVPVLDRTGLSGEYSFDVKFAVLDPSGGRVGPLPWAASPSVFTVLQGQLGLRLTATKGPVETWIIESAEEPSAN